ncbi:hypothetical protein QOL99_08665 [Deinococcus sp. MIMF12]|uniref:Uncharacterized protein n=1 Tax=Deinococcus rhizophilus TaxID=3049544 RepID=A0ABT7JIF2_9DEIO|nr:hypothetical protein [Deinococcus rhizophilus]MDL2344223.1 hypothetical protein [Deinococcus rhizophilus]
MSEGFDFSTDEVLNWEIQAIWEALDSGELRVSIHAQNEINLDALTLDDIYDAISYYDEVTKDRPGERDRAPGLNFDRFIGRLRLRVKVGWRGTYYIVVTAMAN